MSMEYEELAKARENPSEDNIGNVYVLDIEKNIRDTVCIHFTRFFFNRFLAMADFTDEEGYGRYLDMHECYEKYINLKGVDVRF